MALLGMTGHDLTDLFADAAHSLLPTSNQPRRAENALKLNLGEDMEKTHTNSAIVVVIIA